MIACLLLILFSVSSNGAILESVSQAHFLACSYVGAAAVQFIESLSYTSQPPYEIRTMNLLAEIKEDSESLTQWCDQIIVSYVARKEVLQKIPAFSENLSKYLQRHLLEAEKDLVQDPKYGFTTNFELSFAMNSDLAKNYSHVHQTVSKQLGKIFAMHFPAEKLQQRARLLQLLQRKAAESVASIFHLSLLSKASSFMVVDHQIPSPTDELTTSNWYHQSIEFASLPSLVGVCQYYKALARVSFSSLETLYSSHDSAQSSERARWSQPIQLFQKFNRLSKRTFDSFCQPYFRNIIPSLAICDVEFEPSQNEEFAFDLKDIAHFAHENPNPDDLVVTNVALNALPSTFSAEHSKPAFSDAWNIVRFGRNVVLPFQGDSPILFTDPSNLRLPVHMNLRPDKAISSVFLYTKSEALKTAPVLIYMITLLVVEQVPEDVESNPCSWYPVLHIPVDTFGRYLWVCAGTVLSPFVTNRAAALQRQPQVAPLQSNSKVGKSMQV